jgi:hypothetical protein
MVGDRTLLQPPSCVSTVTVTQIFPAKQQNTPIGRTQSQFHSQFRSDTISGWQLGVYAVHCGVICTSIHATEAGKLPLQLY